MKKHAFAFQGACLLLFSAFGFALGIGTTRAADIEVVPIELDGLFALSPAEAQVAEPEDLPGMELPADAGSVSVVVRRFPVRAGETFTLYLGRVGEEGDAPQITLLGSDPREERPPVAPEEGLTRAIAVDPSAWGEASFGRYNLTVAPDSKSSFLYLVAVFPPDASELVGELQSKPVPDLVVEDPSHVEDADSLAEEWKDRHAAGPCSGWVLDAMLLLQGKTLGFVIRGGPSTLPDTKTDSEPEFAVVRVYFGTDRARTGETKPSVYFGPDRGEMVLGACDVSIPRNHRIGKIERPSIWRFEFRENPEKHVVILSLDELDEDTFAGSLQERVAQSEEKQAFVFVHGYNVTFDSAIMRAAQVHYDLAFDGPSIVYSWPSKGTLAGYPADEATIEWTLPHLEEFLKLVSERSGAEKIHLVAHSMGNRAMVRTLVRMIEQTGGLPGNIKNIVLTAPDIDAAVFVRDLAPPLVGSGIPVTLYASDSDNALIASREVHQAPRAGDTGGGLVILEGMDTIDASGKKTDFLGHSYYANSRTVVGDIFRLIRGYPPEQRPGLAQGILEPKGIFWFFRDRKEK